MYINVTVAAVAFLSASGSEDPLGSGQLNCQGGLACWGSW